MPSGAIKHTNATKIITFHSRVKAAQEFASDEVYGIKKFVYDFEVFHVHGKQKSNERKDTIGKFRKSSRSIITNAKCLTEGVDVPAVDMVAFVDPRHSKIDIAQAVGRAMRKPRGGDKKVGYIVVPIYAEDTTDESLEKAIKSEGFDDVALILNSLMEQDQELVDIVSELKQAKGRGEVFNHQRLKDKIEVIGPMIGLEELTRSIYVEAVDRLGESWDEWYGLLTNFVNREGHCFVPQFFNEMGRRLGFWVSTQRGNQKKLGVKRLNLLNELEFVWDANEIRWEEGYKLLVEYLKREGNCLVPQRHYENKYPLGNWVNTQRIIFKKEKLESDRIIKLEDLGFIWDPHEQEWETRFTLLVDFQNKNNHCEVPIDHVENSIKLGIWVNTQRRNKTALGQKKIDRLNSIGFVWDPNEKIWVEGIDSLSKFKKREGHCLVPKRHVEDRYSLGRWVSYLRSRREKLSIEQILILDEIGFIWDVLDDQWEQGFESLKKFREREGHCIVNGKHFENYFSLGQWVSDQRRKKFITEDRIKRLNSIDFVWDILGAKWEEGFNSLVKFKMREGHCRVTRFHIEDGIQLGIWVRTQRKNKFSMSNDRIKRLDNLGFIWNVYKKT